MLYDINISKYHLQILIVSSPDHTKIILADKPSHITLERIQAEAIGFKIKPTIMIELFIRTIYT